ncbi:MAG: flagellar hook-basal body complex protein FliE [Bdellovibrionales bacterium]|nr:flagellar hook-basal body complex protein FliE [Bdellovibrionales bacterium]
MSGVNFELGRIGATRIESPFSSQSAEQLGRVSSPGAAGEAEAAGDGSPKTFAEAMGKLMRDANDTQVAANDAAQEVVAGRNKDLHGAMLAMEKADLQFRLLAQVRNKVIEAYREIMRMQV